ncbi:MAG: hypothetical protein ACRD1B_06090 [Thermoanaerobaculia bacterium]
MGPFAALAVWLGIYQACATAPAPVPLPQSPWGGKYAYSYELPTNMKMRAPGSVPVTIAVVNPSYKEAESALGTELYTKVGKGLSSSMGGDLDKILISKGFTTTGPFPSLAEITYSEKKGAALALAPIVFVTVEIRNSPEIQRANWTELGFAMNVTGWMTFVMEEPLSGQKMWIKKLQLDSVRRDGVVAFESIPEYGAGGCGGQVVRGYKRGEIVYDGRADAMATALKEMYPVILTQFEKYIDADELVQLKEKVKEIREQKVY